MGRVRLYLDDIDDIMALLHEHCGEVQLRAGRAQATSADDLRDATRDELRLVLISGRNPDISVELNSFSAQVRYFNDDQDVVRLAEDVAALANERAMSKLQFRLLHVWLYSNFPLAVVLPIPGFWQAAPTWFSAAAAASVAAFVGAGIFVAAGWMVPLTRSAAVVLPVRRRDRRWTSRPEVVLGAIGALAGSLAFIRDLLAG
ncbi:hypothetical protein AB0B88_23655 [Micromonospora haikouensis]|uniref:hypothetical protein n=1 Tax=Micromonospora haikouensis TaxID=686309 RepID=UPI0033F0C570